MPITLALRIGISRLTMSAGHEHNKIGMMIYLIDHSSLYISYSKCLRPQDAHPSNCHLKRVGIRDGRTKEAPTNRRPSKCLSDTTQVALT